MGWALLVISSAGFLLIVIPMLFIVIPMLFIQLSHLPSALGDTDPATLPHFASGIRSITFYAGIIVQILYSFILLIGMNNQKMKDSLK